ncbi:hypothetical protein HOY80DRAFT_867149, partial [Tuber brumale]
GAGVSTSAGIPDSRKPSEVLYSNLQTISLLHPETTFDISFFRVNAQPFYTLAKLLHPGKFAPAVAQAFLSLAVVGGLL